MAGNDVYLRSVPSDSDQDDVRLYDPTQPDPAPPASGAVLRSLLGVGLSLLFCLIVF